MIEQGENRYAWNRRISQNTSFEEQPLNITLISTRILSNVEDGAYIPSQTLKKVKKAKAFVLCYMSKTVKGLMFEWLMDHNTSLPGIHVFKFAMIRKKCM